MRINSERLEISPSEIVTWGEVETIRILNNKLALELEDGRIIELSDLRSSTVDLVFRTYEKYLQDHPEKPNKKQRERRRAE